MTRLTALVLTVVIATLLSLNSAPYYFHHPVYEIGDMAANSLSVDRAKHFAELYGPYSRWGFHHPGPALFYVQAFGEWLFFDQLHLVPAPFNGQALICLFVEVGFFFAALQAFSQWLPVRARWWFLALAIALAALLFGNPARGHPSAMSAAPAFQSAWPPDVVVLIFLCLLTAGASVAAGRGQDLALLVLAGGLLVHLHVAQPMFVLPCTLLAYAGLVAAARESGNAYGPPRAWWLNALGAVAATWRQHRRAHLLAGVLLLLFVLPVALDFTRGSQSNLAAILAHLRSYRSEHKSLLKSLLYFLQFGGYATLYGGQTDFGDFKPAGVWHYFRVHAVIFAIWLAGCGFVVRVLVRQLRHWTINRAGEPTNRFLAWAGVYLCLNVALTLRWGVIQDGVMYYYNAFVNFAIYYFAALIAAAEIVRLALVLPVITRWRDKGSGTVERVAAVLAAILCLGVLIKQLKVTSDPEENHVETHAKIVRAIAESPAPASVKFLDFPQSTWPLAVATALLIDRAGEKYAVAQQWRTMFGPEYPPEVNVAQVEQTAYRKWSLAESLPHSAQDAARNWIPLENVISLTTDQLPKVDLNDGQAAIFDFHVDSITPALRIKGWSDPEYWGDWISSKAGVLTFPAAPVTKDVELKIDAFPFLRPKQGLSAQRLRISFNGQPVGPELRLALPEQPPIELIIPEAVWNRVRTNAAANAVLELDLPDAISQRDLDPAKTGDPHADALGIRRMTWQEVRPAPPGTVSAATAGDLSGAARDEYTFDGSPLPAGLTRGISEEGWTGSEATVLLPRTAAAAPYLRVEGVAVPAPGLIYPSRFTTSVGHVPAAESTIDAPGPFEVLVPLPAGSVPENINVHLSFPQTFALARMEGNPQDHRELSVLIRSVAITGAQHPVFASYRHGWYVKEIYRSDAWQWSDADSVIEVAAERAGTLVVTGAADTMSSGNAVDVLLDGDKISTLLLPKRAWRPMELRARVSAGKHLLTFHSHLPGVQPSTDTRVLAFRVKDVQFTLR